MLQQTRSKTSYEVLLTNMIDKIKKQGYDNIRADLSGYDSPFNLVSKSQDIQFTPDVTATKNESKTYFEISQKNDDPRQLINKWKLLETLAVMKNGKFQIYVPHGHMKYTQELIKDHNISAELKKL